VSESSRVEGSGDEPVEVDDLTDRRAAPAQPQDLYLEEASRYRPIVTGDIFRDVPVPGSTEEDQALNLTMVVAHPSGMRGKDGKVVERVRAAPIVHKLGLNPNKMVRQEHCDYFQLPLLARVVTNNGFDGPAEPASGWGWGARLDAAAPILTTQLDLAKRVASLSDLGVRFLIQWLGYSDTRVMVRVHRIKQQIDPKLMEIEWLESWNDELVRPLVESGADLVGALEKAAAEFDGVMTEDRGDGVSLAVMLATGCDEAVDGEQRASSLVRAERVMTRERLRRRHVGSGSLRT
jgi:hypothetical protein